MKHLFSLILILAANHFPLLAYTENSFSKLLELRHSGYAYDSTKSIPAKNLKDLAEAARLAPSSYNEQPWTFLFCDKETTPESYQKVLSCLVEFNQNWAKNVHLLIVVSANNKSGVTDGINQSAQYDTGAAAMSLVLKATSLGMMAHQMGGFDGEKLRKEFNIPTHFTPMSVIAIGYEKPDEPLKIRERKPLIENFFLGDWGKGL